MTAHVVYPCCDSLPASLSSFWLKEIGRNKLGFKGVFITDDLIMGALTSYGSIPERAVCALKAGNDLLIVSHSIRECISAVAQELQKGDGLSYTEVEEHRERVQQLIYSLTEGSYTPSSEERSVWFSEEDRLRTAALWKKTIAPTLSLDAVHKLKQAHVIYIVESSPKGSALRVAQHFMRAYPGKKIQSISWPQIPRIEDGEAVASYIQREKQHNQSIALFFILSDCSPYLRQRYGITSEMSQALQIVYNAVRTEHVPCVYLAFAPSRLQEYLPFSLQNSVLTGYIFTPLIEDVSIGILMESLD